MPHEVRDRVIREAFLDAVRSEGVSVQRVRDLAKNTQDFETRNLLLNLGQATREVSSPYTFFLLNGDMELHRNRHLFIQKIF